MMDKVKKIWLNGKLVDWDKAQVHVLTNTLHYGSGAFEGIRCYKTNNGPAVFRLDEHIDRLFYSAECMGIKAPFSAKEIKRSVLELIKYNKLEECYIRPVIFCGFGMGLDVSKMPVDIAIAVWPWGAYLGVENATAIISRYRRLHPDSAVMDAKICGHYFNSILASGEAKKAGANEAIQLDNNGFVAEGPGENIFIVKNKKLYTPAEGSILPGITRDSVFHIAKDLKIGLYEKDISVDELKKADEVFFTGTAVEVCPVVKINGYKIGNGKEGIMTTKIREEYNRIVRGENLKYKKWLTLGI